MESVAKQIRLIQYPLSLFGTQVGRRVTLIRLDSGDVVIHSTAPFSSDDVAAIADFGRPSALLDSTLCHDSFARQGRAMFPDLPYFAPHGFEAVSGVRARSLSEPPPAWGGELDVLLLEGMPRVREHVFFHHPSRTLVLADLLFNFGANATGWTRFFFRHLAGIPNPPGVSRLFRL